MARRSLTMVAMLLLVVGSAGCGGGSGKPVEEAKETIKEAIDLLEKDKTEEFFDKCCLAYFMDRVKKAGVYDKVLAKTKENKDEVLRLLKDAHSKDPGLAKVIKGDGVWVKFPVGLDTVSLCKTNGKFLLSPTWEFISQLFLEEGKEMPSDLRDDR